MAPNMPSFGAAPPLKDSAQHWHLFEWPQELKDIIFDFAYPEIDCLRILCDGLWRKREAQQRMSDSYYQWNPFVPKVNDFLVSWKFLKAAASAYIGNQCLDFLEAMDSMLNDSEYSMIGNYGTYFTLSGTFSPVLTNHFSATKRIEMELSVDDFPDIILRFPRDVILDDTTTQGTQAFTKTLTFKGITVEACLLVS